MIVRPPYEVWKEGGYASRPAAPAAPAAPAPAAPKTTRQYSIYNSIT